MTESVGIESLIVEDIYLRAEGGRAVAKEILENLDPHCVREDTRLGLENLAGILTRLGSSAYALSLRFQHENSTCKSPQKPYGKESLTVSEHCAFEGFCKYLELTNRPSFKEPEEFETYLDQIS